MTPEVIPAYYSSGMAYSLRSDPEIEAAFESLGVTPGTRSRTMREAILAYAALRNLRKQALPSATRDEQLAAVWYDLEQLQATLTKVLNR